jgi:hypothetical protein
MKKITSQLWILPLAILLSVFIYHLIENGIFMNAYQQFSYLAKSFLQGSLAFTESYDGWWHDAVAFNGQHYWPLGPLPAILLMPAQYLANFSNQIFYQGYLQPFLVGICFAVIYRIARNLRFTKLDSSYLSFGFISSTTFLGVAFWPNAWFFAQVVATLFLFLALLEYVGKKRYWLIGILFGLVFATRLTASLGIIFFGLEILLSKEKQKLQKLLQLGIGMLPFVILILLYNYTRFGSLLEQGYSYQNVAGVFGYVSRLGLFHVSYIPSNLYYLLIAPPVPVFSELGNAVLVRPFFKADPWGMGMLFVSPFIFLALLKVKWKTQKNILLLATAIIIALPIVLYYGIGWYQFGYRYSLDFLPFLFFMLLYNLSETSNQVSTGLRVVILISAAINMYLFSTIFIL